MEGRLTAKVWTLLDIISLLDFSEDEADAA